MANRDKSQGIAFVYGDLQKMLSDEFVPWAKDSSVKAVNFPLPEPRRAVSKLEEAPVPESNPTSEEVNEENRSVGRRKSDQDTASIRRIRENLDRLQTLHHKLHAMLEELNQVSGSKKKPS